MENRIRNRKSKNGTAALLALLVMLALLSACTAQAGPATAQTDEIVETFLGDLSANATAAGSLVATRFATLQAPAAARVSEVYVRVGQSVVAGEPLMTLDSAGTALDVAAAQSDVRTAEAALADLLAEPAAAQLAAVEASVESARANLDALLAGPTAAELASSEASLASAQASVASANAELTNAQNSVTDADLAAAEAALASAEIRLNQARERNQEITNQETHEAMMAAEQALAEAQAQVDKLRLGPDTAAAQSNVGAAAARLDANQVDFDQKIAGPTTVQIAQAEAQLASAEATLANLTADPTEAEIASAEADLASARLTLADAEETLAGMTIVAPFDGVVAAVHVQPDEVAGGAVIDLVDLDSLQVVLQVNEVDVGNLAEGQEATITLPGFPGVMIPTEVATIAAAARSAAGGGTVSYDVRLNLSPTDLLLLEGMTVDASLVTAQKKNVLLVPNGAIRVDRTTGTYSVQRVPADGTAAEEVVISIGLRDMNYTEVTSGLVAGDRVLIANVTQSQLQPGGGGLFGGR